MNDNFDKKSPATRADSEDRFCEVVDELPHIVWTHDTAGLLELVNATFCEFFGVTPEAMKGRRWQALLHADDVSPYDDAFRASIDEGRAFHAEARARRADGQLRWLESWGRPRVDARGHLRGYVGTSVDVTERKAVEAALHESERRFRMLADNIAQLAWMANGDGRIVWYNERWFDYTGTTLTEMEGWGWRAVHHPDHVERVVAKFSQSIAAGEVWEDTFPLRGKDGAYRWFLSRAQPIHDAAGRVERWFGTNTDVTEQRETAQRLREQDRRKDDYIAMLGHELRNPLAAIRNATELLVTRGTEDPRLARVYRALARQSAHMAGLIDGLLEVSRLARGKIELDRRIFDLRELLEAVVHDHEAELSARGLRLVRRLAATPVWVAGDGVRLTQVFDNLLGNAGKFTPAPGVIRVFLRSEGERAIVAIRDSGVGILPDMLAAIFEPFRQERQDFARAIGGLGLGLALAKGLVELHDGTIEARSEGPGAGSEFVVALPLAAAPADTIAPPRAETSPRRILLIEDNPDAAQMLRALLELRGHQVCHVDHGDAALELLGEWRPQLVLCDIGLPGMSGYELARVIRADASLDEVFLVALTGYGQAEDRKRAAAAGFDEHLTKPVDLGAIDALLSRDRSQARDRAR